MYKHKPAHGQHKQHHTRIEHNHQHHIAPVDAQPASIASMLGLQRSMGNRAVQRLLQRKSPIAIPKHRTAPMLQMVRVMIDDGTYRLLAEDEAAPSTKIVYELDTESLHRLKLIANDDAIAQNIRVAALTAIQNRMNTENQFGDDDRNTDAMETLKEYRSLLGEQPRQKNYQQWELNRTENDAQQEETQGLQRVMTVLEQAKKSKDSLKRKSANFFLSHPDKWGVLVLHPVRRAKHPRRYYIRCLGDGQRRTVEESAFVGGFFDPNIHAILLRTHARTTGQLMTNVQIMGVMVHELGHMFSNEMRTARDKDANKTKLNTGYKLYKDEFRSYWMEAETGSGPGARLDGQNRANAIKAHILQHYQLVSDDYNNDQAVQAKIDAITTPYLSFNLINSERIVSFYTLLFDRTNDINDVKAVYKTLTSTEKKHMARSPKFIKVANDNSYTQRVIANIQPYLKQAFKI